MHRSNGSGSLMSFRLMPIRPCGHLVGMALELDLPKAIALSTEEAGLEKACLWCFTVVFDRLCVEPEQICAESLDVH